MKTGQNKIFSKAVKLWMDQIDLNIKTVQLDYCSLWKYASIKVVTNSKAEFVKTIEDIKETLVQQKSVLKGKFKVNTLGIFGSYARREQVPSSDIDILVDYDEVPNLLELIELEYYLEEVLQLKIDLVTRKGIKPVLRDSILDEVVYV